MHPAFIFFGSFFNIVSIFSIAKILIQDWKPRLNEVFYTVAVGVLIGLISLLIRLFSYIHFLIDIVVALSLFIFISKLNFYPAKKAVILAFSAMTIFTTTRFSCGLVQQILPQFLPEALCEALLRILPSPHMISAIFVIYIILSYLTITFFSILLVRFTKKVRILINQNKKIQTALLSIIIAIVAYNQGAFIYSIFAPECVIAMTISVIIVISTFIGFMIFTLHLRKKYKRQNEEANQKNLQYYLSEIERQYATVRKFEHDYQNVLLSIDAFLETVDLVGLQQYYSSMIKTAPVAAMKNNYVLEQLSKVKVAEIKSVLAVKLMLAQSLGINVTFEADEQIESIPIDIATLIRMINIIMDNAIEALTELGGGNLFVGCFKEGSGVTLVVQNTCDTGNMPRLYELIRAGFSTKGKRRGFGLNTLADIIKANPNVTREMSVADGNFIQRLTIEVM